jgi:hypothetical protein
MKYRLLFGFRFPILICIICFFYQCKKEHPVPFVYAPPEAPEEVMDTNMAELLVDSCILIPVGQLIRKGSSVDISINDSIYIYDTLNDGLGGFWAIIPYIAFNNNTTSELTIKITKRYTPFQPLELENDSTTAYLKSSKLIKWKNFTEMTYTANQLYDSNRTITENAIAIQEFVINYLDFDDSYANYYGGFTAFQTFVDKRGVCINFSRLFIALCRSVGICSRSVSGVIYKPGNIGEDCFHHHQWCEFLDDNNRWHSIDLTFTRKIDISDIRYIDFTYCAEETEIFSDYYTEFMQDPGQPFKTDNECVIVYSYLPTMGGARFGFKLVKDDRPFSVVFEKKVYIRKENNTLYVIPVYN